MLSQSKRNFLFRTLCWVFVLSLAFVMKIVGVEYLAYNFHTPMSSMVSGTGTTDKILNIGNLITFDSSMVSIDGNKEVTKEILRSNGMKSNMVEAVAKDNLLTVTYVKKEEVQGAMFVRMFDSIHVDYEKGGTFRDANQEAVVHETTHYLLTKNVNGIFDTGYGALKKYLNEKDKNLEIYNKILTMDEGNVISQDGVRGNPVYAIIVMIANDERYTTDKKAYLDTLYGFKEVNTWNPMDKNFGLVQEVFTYGFSDSISRNQMLKASDSGVREFAKTFSTMLYDVEVK